MRRTPNASRLSERQSSRQRLECGVLCRFSLAGSRQGNVKTCGYCGKENADEALVCAACGTPFPSAPSASPEPPVLPVASPAPKPTLNGKRATLILVAYIAAQFTAAALVELVAGIEAGIQGRDIQRPGQMAQLREKTFPLAMVLAIGGGGVVMVLASLLLAGPELRDSSRHGAAWLPGSAKHIAQGLAAGILGGCCYVALAGLLGHASKETNMGPLTKMAMTPGLPRLIWIAIGIGVAPITEELLFRGVLYGGYCRSLGPGRAAALTTFIFWLMHITEMIHFPLSMVAILLLALGALWFRLRSAAIGPAVAVHFGYNGVLALLLVLSDVAKRG